ncbi:MAG: FAD:protein FMN transferase [Bacteroidales bacterium]|jgi:thiamine biosynthesis lipoprotein|nr:FAD:protein FMN transferase [Bacteroidales bacterium]
MNSTFPKNIFFTCILFIGIVSCSSQQSESYSEFSGNTQGTTYRIIAKHSVNADSLAQEIQSLLKNFETVFSNYNPHSLISQSNSQKNFQFTDSLFFYFIKKSQFFYELTHGAFDITVAPIANAWKFGYANDSIMPSGDSIDKIMKYVGMNLITIGSTHLIKKDERTQIISNAIAQGYTCDIIAEYFTSLGIKDFLIDVGGEMRVQGVNPQGKLWQIGIQTPREGASSTDFMLIVPLNNKSIATSGNYRKYYIKNGKKYSHTINPKTGYPITHNLLSASIITEECIDADALATSCMVIGLEKAQIFFTEHPEYQGVLIYEEADSLQTYITPELSEKVIFSSQ